MRISYPAITVLVLIAVAFISRILVMDWGLPYSSNLAHEHSLFYDSRAVVHDQYRAMYALYHFPQGLVTDAVTSLMPLLQRYLAAPFIALWFALTHGTTPDAVQAAPRALHFYQVIVVNRVISIVASVGLIAILAIFLRRLKMNLVMSTAFLAVFVMNPVEIGLSLHEKTISLLWFIMAVEFLFLQRWVEAYRSNQPHHFRYIFVASMLVGVAGAAREQGIFFGGLLLLIALGWITRENRRTFFTWRRAAWLVIGPIIGLAITSPDFLVKWSFWLEKFTHPGRPWDFHELWLSLPDLWPVLVLFFAGEFGVGLWLVALVVSVWRFRLLSPAMQVFLIWYLVYLGVFSLYPMKAPRFAQPLVLGGLVFIGYFFVWLSTVSWYRRPIGRGVVMIAFLLWFIQSIAWGVSTLAFFAGGDNRIEAANDFHATVKPGASVATYYTYYHTLQEPIDEKQYDLYWYDHQRQALISETGKILHDPADWPEYIIVQHEVDAVWYPREQRYIQAWRDRVQGSNLYELIRVYPKRVWHGSSFGLFGTRSRWTYLNPVVEVYQRKSTITNHGTVSE